MVARVRTAVIGLGMASAPHVRSLADLHDQVDVVAAFSPSAERRRAFNASTGLPVCDDLNDIFGDASIEAVMLLTPPNTHLDLVGRACDAGKHILLEKPLDISVERSEALVVAAEQAGRTLAIVLQHRFRPVSRKLAEILAEKRLGDIVSASARLHNWRPQSYYDQPGRGTLARDGGGVLLTQAIHTLDLLISLAGLPVEASAFCATSAIHRMETEDLAMGAVRFGNGAIGAISATTCAYPGFSDAIDIIGTEGMAMLDGGALTVRYHDGSTLAVSDDGPGGGAGADPMAFPHQHHRAVLADFLHAVRSGVEPTVSGRDALRAHYLIDAMLRSSRSGRTEQVAGNSH